MVPARSDRNDQHRDAIQSLPKQNFDDIQREKEVLRLISGFNILIGNSSNQYAALLKSQIRQQPELNVVGICQTSKHLEQSIPVNDPSLMVITLSHLLDGPIDALIRSLQDETKEAQIIIILKNNERIFGFKDIIKSKSVHVIDESSIGNGGMFLCLQSISTDHVFKDPVAVKRLQKENESGQCLSQRELEVIALVAKGLSNREIADRLHIAHVTARDHVNRVLRKLGAKDRTEAAVMGLRLGVID